MRIDPSLPVTDVRLSKTYASIQIQAENRDIIQAVRAVNASAELGNDNELTFSLDRQTRRTVIKIVNRTTKEVVGQIPNEQVLRLAEDLRLPGRGR